MNNNIKKTCCEAMALHLKEKNIEYYAKFREYGIPVKDGGTSFIEIFFCPWCGQKLPTSLRDRWFELLDQKGVDYDDEENIPENMKTDSWWLDNGQ